MPAVEHVVILVQENHTVDNYFRGLAPYGANVAADWSLTPNPPAHDQPHDRHAYYDWLTGASHGEHAQFDTAKDIPYYLYLALTGAFLENHCAGFGTNSTPNHLLIVGGQSPTLKNPSRSGKQPVWDMPSLPGLAGAHRKSWRFYAASNKYPIGFYEQVRRSRNIRASSDFVTDVHANGLPALSFLYHDPPLDEHPPADVTEGMNAVWHAVDAVVDKGLWETTVFMLTWDDWGGWDDHVRTPCVEYTPDNVQLAYGPRVPLLLFGGHVKSGIDSRWCSHVSIPKTAMELLGLPALGVPRLDEDAGLADLVDSAITNPPPPKFGTAPPIPAPPARRPNPRPLPTPPAGPPKPTPLVVLRNGKTLPPPNDAPLPQRPAPPG
ncbi:MAG TPA: alkaline phosphatase family protein [Gaiellaceae bacterium]